MTRREQMLAQYHEQHMSVPEIAAAHGITHQRVYQIIGRTGTRPSRTVASIREERLAAYGRISAGQSTLEEEAEKLGLSTRYLRQYLRESLELELPGAHSLVPKHGTHYRYAHDKCRCRKCRKAEAEYRQMLRDRAAENGPPSHGKSGYFNHGCKCDICRAAGSKENKRQRRRRKRQAALDAID